MQSFPNVTMPANTASMDKYGNTSLNDRMEQAYLDAVTPIMQYWSEASVDTRFYAGDQTVWNEIYGNVRISNNRQFNFNLIRRVVEMTGGTQRKNRKSTVVVPIQNADDHTADQFTKILLWLNKQDSSLETVSEAFTGALITGMNLLQVWLDFREDPINGDLRTSSCAYNTFMIDPFFKKQDLSDCRFLWKRSFLSNKEAASLLPDQYDFIMGLSSTGTRDGKFQYMPESYNYHLNNLLQYDEFYYRDYRSQRLIVDEKTGGSMEWKGEDDMLRLYMQEQEYLGNAVSVVNQLIPTVKMGISIQGNTMYEGANNLGIDRYPFVPVLGYYTPEMPYLQYRCQGMVRSLRDPQYLFNRRKIIELDIFESQPNSGWIAEEDSVVDPKSLYKTGQGQVIWKKKGVPPESLQQIAAPQVPPSMFQASTDMEQLVMKISGANEENMGTSSDDIAGIISMLRQNAGMTTQQRLFDQLDLSQKLWETVRLEAVQQNFTPGKVAMILGEQPSERFFNKNFGKYDCVIEDGFNTSTQRQMQFAQALQLRQVGVPVPDSFLIESATLQNKKDLVSSIEQEKQAAQQMQQAQAQTAIQEQQATMAMAYARAQADQAMARERESRIEENKALSFERIAKARNEEENAELARAKTLHELQSLKLDELEKLIALSQVLKQEEIRSFQDSALQQTDLMNKLELLRNNGMTTGSPMVQPPMGQ